MKLRDLIRTFAAPMAGGALVVGLTTSGGEATTLSVDVFIDASCTVGNDVSGGFSPNYDAVTDTSTGQEIGLGFGCTGTSPKITFTDPSNVSLSSTVFKMHDIGNAENVLNYQISNTASCTGIAGDTPLVSGFANPITETPGVASVYDICVAVLPGQQTAAPGHYIDTVTYTVDPGN